MNKKLFFCLVILLGSLMAPLHAARPTAAGAAKAVRNGATSAAGRLSRLTTAASRARAKSNASAEAATQADTGTAAATEEITNAADAEHAKAAAEAEQAHAKTAAATEEITNTADEEQAKAAAAKANHQFFTSKNAKITTVVIAGLVAGGAFYKQYLAPRLATRVKKMKRSRLKDFLTTITFAR